MRVLAIRGRNLASLNGDFEVDFEAEPLSDAGIFAITGPTGAGKSTLLDAMCLALFDSVPRLGAAPARARIETAQGDELTAGDPRAILRHGSGEGFAELDFVGRDGERYRARWTVKRAHNKINGRLQGSRHSLTRLTDGQILGGTKVETLAEIHRIVGLTAEQFRRAVLLAQGDFEAFIKADDNERAQLLERLTGSHIYASLGRAAHEKATTLRTQQQAILDRIEAQNGLADEARQIAEEQHSAAKDIADRTASTLGELSKAVRWESDRTALANKVTECELAVSTANTAREEAAPRHEALRLRKAAFALAGDWTAVQDAATLAQEARQTVVLRQSELEQASERATQTAAEEGRAAAQLQLETERVAAQSPEIEEARVLDRKLSETNASLDGIADVRAARAQALSRCRELEQAANTLVAEAAESRDAQGSWLTANAGLAALAAQQQELAAELVEIAAVDMKLSELSESAKEAKASKIEANATWETAAATARFDEVESQAKGWEEDQLRLTNARKILLGGETVDIVVARNEAALSQSRRALEVAQIEASKAREQQAAATAHKESANQEAERRIKDHLDRQGRFHARLSELAIEEDAVADAARAGQKAIDQEAEALANIDRAAEQAAALLTQRQQDLTRHDETDPPSLSGETLAQAVNEAKQDDEAAQRAFQDAQFVLRRDDEVRTQTTKLRADLARERAAARVWLALDELIGDATGARFRRFAQGLTLDRLLAHANSRLTDLKPRYELQRASGADMLIQVIDHDMAGEIRGVHNLSGGERFLISLALALGLAEMSTGRGLKIESLFIDEGFGALDGASLGQALSVLEHLHATGRRVGVISHVEEIKERIPVKIEVTPVARGRSELTIVNA